MPSGPYNDIGDLSDPKIQGVPIVCDLAKEPKCLMDKASSPKSVYVVEDAPAIRQRIAELLEESEAIRIVGEADNPKSAIREILRIEPDSVVLDIQLIGGSGIEVLDAIHPTHPHIVFIMLTNFPSEQYRKKCMASGASYFLDKNSEFLKMRDAIHRGVH